MKAQWRPVGSYLATRCSGLLLHVPTHLHMHQKVWLCSRRGTVEFASVICSAAGGRVSHLHVSRLKKK